VEAASYLLHHAPAVSRGLNGVSRHSVFVAEGEMILSMVLDHMHLLLGGHVAGNAASLPDGLNKARQSEFDLTIFDLKLDTHSGEPVWTRSPSVGSASHPERP
jgi:hypothetical protein